MTFSLRVEMPPWAKPGADEHGNVACASCGKFQSPHFKACIHCCPHIGLNLTEEWHGPDDGGNWELEAHCATCGRDICREELIGGYKLVRK